MSTGPTPAPPAPATERPGPTSPRPKTSSGTRWRIVLALVLLALVVDWTRPGPEQASARVLLASIDVYQATLSKAMPTMGVSCRFTPTCSHYAEAVIARDGAVVGSARAAWRIARCGPWTEAGTVDEP